MSSSQNAGAPPLSRAQALTVQVAMGIAAAVAFYLFRNFMLKTYGTEAFDSVCNVNETFNCDKINTSVWGKIFGIPITVLAIPAYGAMGTLAWLAGGSGDRARGALAALVGMSSVAVAYGIFLLAVMAFVEKTFCLFCMAMDLMSFVTCGVAWVAYRARGGGGRDLKAAVPALGVAGVALLAMLGVHGAMKSGLLDKQAEALTAAPATASAAPVVAAAAGLAPCGASLTARQVGDKPPVYDIPIRDCDAVRGPKDPKVTVIEYADFQCGYCKKLFYAIAPLKEKYKDDVRFVFKHFPMDTTCNSSINNNRHRYACQASRAAECARRQDRFWEMHDLLFKNQHKLQDEDLRWYAEQIGVDGGKWAQCMSDPGSLEHIRQDVALYDSTGIEKGTPRTFINGRFFKGVLPQETLERIIDQELGRQAAGPAAASAEPAAADPAKAPPMTRVALGERSFFIDSFEASLDGQGRALSLPGVRPANASWFEASAACKASGKRLCTTEEWVAACQGAPAVDDDGDGDFSNDYIEGRQFPYADWYEAGYCQTEADRDDGAPVAAGSKARCATPEGVFDLAGNVSEWSGLTEGDAKLLGGDYRSKDKSGCFRPVATFGPGHKNEGIGFRCCADGDVANPSAQAVAAAAPADMVGKPLPLVDGTLMGGGGFDASTLKGKVVYLTFFASWCGPCRRELPALNELLAEYGPRGLVVIGVGVDSDVSSGGRGAAKSEAMARQAGVQYPVILDPANKVLGRFDVQSMPTTYIVGRDGVIKHKQVGFGDETLAKVKVTLEGLL